MWHDDQVINNEYKKLRFLKRYITEKIIDALKVSPVVFVNGPRQAGKSTLVNSLSKNSLQAEYVSFDKATYIAAATNAPYEFLTGQGQQTTLIVDEVQLVPGIFRVLKEVVDEMRLQNKAKANGRFLLTGSANILSLPKLSDALVGRMITIPLLPFAVCEVVGGKGNALERILAKDFSHLSTHKITLFEAIGLATFPEISRQNSAVSNIWFDGYITTILQRDVRMLAELEKVFMLPLLLKLLASRVGNILNDADISRDLGLNAVTTKFYRKILQMMFLHFEVKAWFRNINKRLVKSSKGYLIDTLMLCYILGYNLEDIMKNKSFLMGLVVENFVATELTKLLSFSNIRAELLYFRTSDGKEVDFVLECVNNKIVGIEVKAAETVSTQDFKGLNELFLHTKNDFVCGIVLYQGKKVVPFGENLWAVPLHFLWQ